jgi:hypothetical protein
MSEHHVLSSLPQKVTVVAESTCSHQAKVIIMSQDALLPDFEKPRTNCGHLRLETLLSLRGS